MSIEKINQAKAEIASTSAYKTITEFLMQTALLKLMLLQSPAKVLQRLLQALVQLRVCLFTLSHRTATFAAVL